MESLQELFERTRAIIYLSHIQTNEIQHMLKQVEIKNAKYLKNKIRQEILREKTMEKTMEKRIVHSGIQQPRTLSDKLCAFLNMKPGTCLSRPNVTKLLNKYIKDHALYSKEQKRLIADETLSKLIGPIPDDFILTYFTIQKCMNSHYL